MAESIIDALAKEGVTRGDFERDVRMPAIVPPSERSLMDSVKAMKQILDTREGRTGSVLDKALTLRDLIKAGAMELNIGGKRYGSQSGSFNFGSQGAAALDDLDPRPILATPPALTDFSATGLYRSIFLKWSMIQYRNHAYVQIWRASTDSLGSASVVGTSTANLYVDESPGSGTKYYWVRAVGYDSSGGTIYGPFNAVAGTAAALALSPAELLTALAGQITASELHPSLGERINLIDGSSSLAGSVNARLQAEASARAADLLAEAAARGAAITAEETARQSADNSLSSQITTLTASVSSNAAAISSEATARANADSSLATQIALVTAGVGEQFDYKYIWHFDSGIEGWSGSATPTASGGLLHPERVSGGFVSKGGLNYSATAYPTIKIRLRKTGSPTWAGKWRVTGPGGSPDSGYIAFTEPAWDGLGNGIATIDMGPSWTGTVDNFYLKFDGTVDSSNYYSVDWLALGRPSPGASFAALLEEQTARASADSALASDITALTATVSSNTAAITSESLTRAAADSATATQVATLTANVASNAAAIATESSVRAALDGSVRSLYTVRAEVTSGGRTVVGGFGLAGTATASEGPRIDFGVRADRFWVGAPAGAGVPDSLPFVIQTVDTVVNGVTIPKGVYMDAAYIVNLGALTARLGSAWIDSAMIASLDAAKVNFGVMSGDRIELNTLNGDRLIGNSVTAGKIDARGLSIYSPAGALLFNAGSSTPIDWSQISGTAAISSGASLGSASWGALNDPNTGLGQRMRLNAQNILAGPGGFSSGTLTWDAAGNRTGGVGVGFTAQGIVGYSASGPTFTIDASTGAATFGGTLSAAGGTFTGALVGATGSFSGSLSAASGTLGALTIAAGGNIKLRATAYNTDGLFIGESGGVERLSLKNGTKSLLWDGTDLLLNNVSLDTFSASITGGNISLSGLASGEASYGSRTVSVTGGRAPFTYFWVVSQSHVRYSSIGQVISAVYINSGAASPTASFRGRENGQSNTANVACFVRDSNGRVAMATMSIFASHNFDPGAGD